jgi:hypothetical protein
VKNIYFISGLGANTKVYDGLKIEGDFKLNYLEWLIPTSEDESIEAYAQRMAESIDTSSEV